MNDEPTKAIDEAIAIALEQFGSLDLHSIHIGMGTNEVIESAYQAAIKTCFDTLVSSLAGAGVNEQEKREAAKQSYAACVAVAKEARDTARKIPIEDKPE